MTKLLYVTEFAEIKSVNGSRVQAPVEPALVVQAPIDYTSAHAESSAFNSATRFVEIVGDAAGHFIFGTAPTATTSHTPMAAGERILRAVGPQTAALKVSAV